MAVLEWHEGLNVGVGFMDDDHMVAADQINALAEAALPQRLDLARDFLDHCRHHFAREEEMMKATGFFALGCHQGEHERVLAELEGVVAKLEQGDPQDTYFTKSLPEWLMIHRNTMDFVTAEFARNAGWRAA